ncbi:MAG: RT0821/Lpp0805 family surface protein [Alphaproteobacteria bacterium]|nr:RT0821/Lpp0805 family surface protein [Alphaproteobacteria bacterium]
MLGSATLPLSGCLSSGFGLGGNSEVDQQLVTGSIPDYPMLKSDDEIITSAVSEANTKRGSLQNIPWTNIGTGTTGTIVYVGERRSVTEICREFITSKHSYDGIAQFHGKICRTRMGKTWELESIEEQG